MNEYRKYISVASTLHSQKRIPNIKAKIFQSQNETKNAILKLLNQYENEEFSPKKTKAMPTEPNSKREETKMKPKAFNIPSFTIKKRKKKAKTIITHLVRITPRKETIRKYDTLPQISSVCKNTIDTFTSSQRSPQRDHSNLPSFQGGSVKNSMFIADQCDNIVTECSLVKDSIIRNPIKVPPSNYYLPHDQIKANLHKTDRELLGDTNHSNESLQKKKILEQSLIIKKISNSLAYDAQKVLLRLFDSEENDKGIADLHNTLQLQKQAKLSTKRISRVLFDNITANLRCKKYLERCNLTSKQTKEKCMIKR